MDEIRKEEYLLILQLKSMAIGMKLEHNWLFKQENNPKHTSELVLEWIKWANLIHLEYLYQNSDLNPIENLWTRLNSYTVPEKQTS